jgi:hypothetical protein
MSSYGDMAWTYNENDLGLDPETKLPFVPNKKELDLFKQEKTDMYKGTWMVCFIYGISAIILLSIIFFTEWGRTYIYDKFLPAVITYVVGAIIIIIYLVTSIFSLMPRKIGKGVDAIPICPDYWKLEATTIQERQDIAYNINNCKKGGGTCNDTLTKGSVNDQYILKNDSDPVIKTEDSPYLKYKCVPDQEVFGNIYDLSTQKNDLSISAQFNTGGTNEEITTAKYIYSDIPSTDKNESIKKYAQVSGVYKKDWKTASTNDILDRNDLRNSALALGGTSSQTFDYSTNPLICNVVYPGIIGAMEDTKNTDALRCDYAQKCGISWSKLDCLKK